jgi:ABC-type nitrate/sulfonate/bicarbonate transport system substrate-binding protein
MNKKKIFPIILVLLLFRCESEKKTVPTKDPEKLSIGTARDIINSMTWIAKEKGCFEAEGLDVTLQPYPSGKLALLGMLDNKVQVATSAEVPVISNLFKKQGFSIFGTVGMSDNEIKIVARRDAGINIPADLKGKRIATQKNSAVHFFLYRFLIYNSLTEPELNISYLHPEELVPALVNGDIDAFSMREPFIQKARDHLGDNIIIFEQPGIYTKTFNLIAHNKFIHDNPETIRKILRAFIRAEQYLKQNRRKGLEIIAKLHGIDKENLENKWDDYIFELSLYQSLLITLEAETRWAIKTGLIDKKEIPNYLNHIYLNAMDELKPQALTIIH